MAANDGISGTLFEGLLIGDEQAKLLATEFSNKNLKIISPTVAGFLSGLKQESDFAGFNLAGCSIDYLSEFNKNPTNETEETSNISEALIKEFAESAVTFVNKVSDMRAPYIPVDLRNSAFLFGTDGRPQTKMESHENAFMRMLGLPSDADLKTSQNSGSLDPSLKLIYFSPEKTSNNKIVRELATLEQILGQDNSGPESSHILAERRKVIDQNNSEKRIYDFTQVSDNDIEYFGLAQMVAEAKGTATENATDSSNITEIERIIAYHNPNDLYKVYYLKSIPIQDSSVYGCITDTTKIIAKPFDLISYQKFNGNKPKTSLLETIIRIRLDRITGNPGIYAYDPDSQISGITVNPDNVDKDKITEVECFLIQKLKRILYLLAEKYIADINKKGEIYLKELKETGKISSSATQPKNPSDKGSDKPTGTTDQDPTIVPYPPELEQLEILKAKEDAILFLLKDTSSSYSAGGANSQYSSLDIQEGIIRSSSGFGDILSGPLYSMLSHRSEQLDKLIKQKRQELDSAKAKNSGDGGQTTARSIGNNGLSLNPNQKTYTYYGICSEDFIVYTLAFLIIDQDYLIGLLPYENRKNLANTISNSILNTGGKNKDPYGVVERILKTPEQGGFPSVKDSVNALSILVSSLYEEYILYIKNQNAPQLQKLKETIDATRQPSSGQ
jgi:hypothetical protein